MIRILCLLLMMFAAPIYAHEDHGPSTVAAPKGGVMRTLDTVHVELVRDGNTLKFYVYSLDLKPADAAKYPVKLSVALPKKKAEALKMTTKSDHWESAFDAKGAHRYTAVLNITQGGHEDKVEWVVEPRKK